MRAYQIVIKVIKMERKVWMKDAQRVMTMMTVKMASLFQMAISLRMRYHHRYWHDSCCMFLLFTKGKWCLFGHSTFKWGMCKKLN